MKVAEIDTLAVDDTMPLQKRRMRLQAPRYLQSVINDTKILTSVRSLEALRPEHIKPLSGGVDAATYLLNHPEEQVIIKFGLEGVKAEAEAIGVWQAHHVRVPKIIGTGIVPITKGKKQQLYYLVQRALVDETGRLIETADAYLVYAPKKARKVGIALGKELHNIHSSVSDRFFGEFSDRPGSKSNYKSWNGYVVDAIKKERAYLTDVVGIADDTLRQVIEVFQIHQFIKIGRYLHGDFSIRNVGIKSRSPLKVSIFDPNPLIGDPSWDVSFLINNYEFEKRRLAYDESQRDLYIRHQQLWIGFKQGYTRRINLLSLYSAQLVQATYQAQYTDTIKDTIGSQVRREFIQDLCQKIISYENHT